MRWDFEVSRGKLLCAEWINNKVLWYSTGNATQYLIITYNRKESENFQIPKYFAAHLKVKQYYKPTTLNL